MKNAAIKSNNNKSSPPINKVGKVFKSILSVDDVDEETWKKYGGEFTLGGVLFSNYPDTRHMSDVDVNECDIALPLYPNNIYVPLKGELIYIVSLPNKSYNKNKHAKSNYYITSINLWNNYHHNSINSNKGVDFVEQTDVKNQSLKVGDYLINGRWGHSILFSSSPESDPIINITNNLSYKNINLDGSNIVLSKGENLDLNIQNSDLQQYVYEYKSNQTLIKSQRVIIYSSDDDIILSSNKDILLNGVQNNIVGKNINLISKNIHIGPQEHKEFALLGDTTINLIEDLIKSISSFSTSLKNSGITSAGGVNFSNVMAASSVLSSKMNSISKQTLKCKSKYITLS